MEGELIESFAIRSRRFSLIFIAISIRRECLILSHVHFGLNLPFYAVVGQTSIFFIKTLVTLRTRNLNSVIYHKK